MPEKRWLVLSIQAPLLAFGGVTIDHVGVTRDFPASSMITGLFANALGWRRTQFEDHQKLQDRLVVAARRDDEASNSLLTDVQNAKLGHADKGWTTGGTVEARGGSGGTYKAPHRRKRTFHMDADVRLVVRLEPEKSAPDLDCLAAALDRPKRPLFIGRKPCLPTNRLFGGFVEAPTAYQALRKLPTATPQRRLRALWPGKEGPQEGSEVHRIIDLPDIRNWPSGLHGGVRTVVEGFVCPESVAS